jgi:hypothetical protein
LKAVKARVPLDMKDAKKTMGMTVNAKGGKQTAKVGAAVGRGAKAQSKSSRTRPGVGIGGRNIHWFILGTAQRATKAGKNTGAMPSQMPDVIKGAAQGEKSQITEIIRSEATARLAQLAAAK